MDLCRFYWLCATTHVFYIYHLSSIFMRKLLTLCGLFQWLPSGFWYFNILKKQKIQNKFLPKKINIGSPFHARARVRVYILFVSCQFFFFLQSIHSPGRGLAVQAIYHIRSVRNDNYLSYFAPLRAAKQRLNRWNTSRR